MPASPVAGCFGREDTCELGSPRDPAGTRRSSQRDLDEYLSGGDLGVQLATSALLRGRKQSVVDQQHDNAINRERSGALSAPLFARGEFMRPPPLTTNLPTRKGGVGLGVSGAMWRWVWLSSHSQSWIETGAIPGFADQGGWVRYSYMSFYCFWANFKERRVCVTIFLSSCHPPGRRGNESLVQDC